MKRVIKVRCKIDGIPIYLGQHLLGNLGQASLSVAHCCWRIVVHAPEITLSVDEPVPHGEVLGHSHHGIINGGIAVRVVFTHDLTYNAGALLVGAVVSNPQFVHAVENPSLHRL
ncbi:MAG: hypothetical protein DDT27_01183 [Dehalococcoidia bacterium]|nr:hypothetical protein [Chloroflexota bacterium]